MKEEDKRKKSEQCIGIKIGCKNGKNTDSQTKLKSGTCNIKMPIGRKMS